ncbi:MAG: c-type cytochrome [Blastocatellia bacterium]
MKSRPPRMIKLAVILTFSALASGYFFLEPVTFAITSTSAAQTKNPLQATEKNIALGLDHFDAHCASCHGAAGKADTDKGKAVGAADLTSDKVQSKSDAELFRIISRGVPGTAMPAFGKTHKPTEIWQTIHFLRKLPTLTPDERAKLEAAIPAGARHKQGSGQQHKHLEPQPQLNKESEPQHEHPMQTPAKPAANEQQSATQHQHEMPKTQQGQKPSQPEHMHEQAKPPAQQPTQAQPQKEHQHDTQPSTNQPGEMKHDMSKMGDMHAGHDMNAMMSTITGGPFKSMHAIGSGTSLLPSSTPGYMWHWMKGDWMIMAHGNLIVGFNHQGGPRGINKAESQNWLMLMAEREAGVGG